MRGIFFDASSNCSASLETDLVIAASVPMLEYALYHHKNILRLLCMIIDFSYRCNTVEGVE